MLISIIFDIVQGEKTTLQAEIGNICVLLTFLCLIFFFWQKGKLTFIGPEI